MPARSKRDMTAPAERNMPAPDLLVLLHERADAQPPVRLTLAPWMRRWPCWPTASCGCAHTRPCRPAGNFSSAGNTAAYFSCR